MMHARISARTLGVVRVWVFAIWLFVAVTDDFQSLAVLPDGMFEPYGVLNLLPSAVWRALLTPSALLVFKALLTAFVALTVVGARPFRPIALTSVVLLTLHQGLVRGFGFVNHAELALLYAAYVLAVAPSAERMAVGRPAAAASAPEVRSLAMVLITLLPLLAYAAIALFRVAHAGPDIFLGDSMMHYVGRSTFRSSFYGMSWGEALFLHPHSKALLNAGFFVVTLFEIASPFCLFSRRLRIAWLSVIVPFHISTLLLMNIFFWENLLLFMVTMTEIEHVVDRAAQRWAPLLRRAARRSRKMA